MSEPDESLKQIPIHELSLGMFVHGIVDQKGNLSVKSQGTVTHRDIIDDLKSKGVRVVVVDPSRQAFKTTQPPKSTTNPSQQKKTRGVSLADEVRRAYHIQQKGKIIQKALLRSVQKGELFDQTISKEFAQEMVGSIDRNPNALMCLTKMRKKDDYLLEHCLNVAVLLANFGRHIGMRKDQVEKLAHVGILHDIGKIKITDSILQKEGRLTDTEMTEMQRHVEYGIEALRDAGIEESMIRTVAEHHERLDGTGYPAGLRGDDISLEGQMIGIVDVYDALTADRVYKRGMPTKKALQILFKDTPHKVNPELLQRFVKSMGIYPIGSLVKLDNERLAVVVEQNEESPLKPKVRTFYSTRGRHYLEVKEIDLSLNHDINIESAAHPSDFGVDYESVLNMSVLNEDGMP